LASYRRYWIFGRGRLLYPAEVEQVLVIHPAVKEARVAEVEYEFK